METLERILAEHPFFAGLESYYIEPAGGMCRKRAVQRRQLHL